jgi:ureidoglycolate lyase
MHTPDSIPVSPLTASAFAPFGRVVRTPDGEPTAASDAFRFWSDVAAFHIEGETEIGVCTVYRQPQATVDWMERHLRTPEVLIPTDGPFVLPVMSADGPIRAFRVEMGEAVVIADGVWHSACHPLSSESATYLVVFRRGTPHEDVEKLAVGPVSITV